MKTTAVLLGALIALPLAAQTAFYPITPCRVADTRNAVGPLGGPIMAYDSERSFPVLQSNCGVPATAQAYALNVTVVPQGPLMFLTMWPDGKPRPLASTLNSWGGTVLANSAIVPAGTSGAIRVYTLGLTHVILDINGYYAPGVGAGTQGPAGPPGPAGQQGAPGPVGPPGQVVVPTPIVSSATVTVSPDASRIDVVPVTTIGSFPGPANITAVTGTGLLSICARVNAQKLGVARYQTANGTLSNMDDMGPWPMCPWGTQPVATCAVIDAQAQGCLPWVGKP